MREIIDITKALTSYRWVREQYIFDKRHLLPENVKRHLHRGFLVRVAMMDESVITINEELTKAQKPLGSYLSARLTLLLNSYYLNLSGSLDNLAWALTYHHNLLENIDENNIEHRKFTQLLGKKFLQNLRQKSLKQLADELELCSSWYKEVKEFRDPAAHRIPLSIPHAVYSEEDVEKRNVLDKKSAELFSKGLYDEGMNFMRQIEQLGKQMPEFISENSKIERYDISGRINLDHENWDKVVKSVFQLGFV